LGTPAARPSSKVCDVLLEGKASKIHIGIEFKPNLVNMRV
jgi:hypothetical protein